MTSELGVDLNLRQKGVRIIKPLIYGNVARYFGHKREDGHTHQWTVYVKPFRNEDMTAYIQKVTFKLHDSYANSLRVVTEPPYEVTETGWGEFDVVIRIYFNDTKDKPIMIVHLMKLFQSEKQIQEGTKNLVIENYDELVFDDPSALQQHLLTSQRPLTLNTYKHETDFDALKQSQLATLRKRHAKIRDEIRSLVNSIRHRQLLTLRYRKRCAVEARRIYLQQRQEIRGTSSSGGGGGGVSSDCSMTGDESSSVSSAAQRLKHTSPPHGGGGGGAVDIKTEEDIVDIEGIGENPYAAPSSTGHCTVDTASTAEEEEEEDYDENDQAGSLEEDERIRAAELQYAATHNGKLPDEYLTLKLDYEANMAAHSTSATTGKAGRVDQQTEGLKDIIFAVDEDPYMSDKYDIEDVFQNLEMDETETEDDDLDDLDEMDVDDSDALMSEDSQSLEVVT